MSEHDNGNGNITNNQNEEPTMIETTTANPEPKIQITAEHCRVADVQVMEDITDTPCLFFRLASGAVDRLQCIAYHELMSDPLDIDSLNSGDTVTLTGFLQQHCEGASPRVADLCLPALFVDSLRVEKPPYPEPPLPPKMYAPTALPPGAKPW